MRQFIRFLLIPGFIGWILGGCSEKIEPKPPTYSQLLTGTDKKTWKMASLQIIDAGNASAVIPISQLNVDPCITDELLTFYANSERKLEVSQNTIKCYPNEPDIYITDNWTLVNANATLDFYIPLVDAKVPWIIKNLTSTSMTVQYYFPDFDASYRFTFVPVTTK